MSEYRIACRVNDCKKAVTGEDEWEVLWKSQREGWTTHWILDDHVRDNSVAFTSVWVCPEHARKPTDMRRVG